MPPPAMPPVASTMAACSACLVDISYETEGGAACCDEAWERFGRNCAFLSGQWGLDCSGCLCPGDLEEPPPVPPLPPHAPPEPPSPPEAPQPPLRPPLPPASPTGLGDAQFRCGFDGDHIATVDTTAALVAAVSDNSVSCIKLAPQTFALDATVQIDRPLAIAADDGPATLDGGGSVGPLLSFGSLASVALFNLVLTNAFGSMNGGALYGGPGSSLELSFVTFDSNSVDLSNYAGNGAGLYFSGLSLRMADCTFVDNVAASSGGMLIKPQSVFGEEFGITSGEPFEFFAERCIFDSNVAAYFIGGGATFQFQLACGVTVEIHDSTFSGNRAGQLGGGIVAMGCADDAMEVRDTAFTSNAIEESSAAVGGAAIYAYDMNMNVVGCTISNNAAPSSQGGGVFVKNGRVVLTSTRIKDNLAASGANLYLSQQASYVMPLPDGMWLPASACLVYRVGCPFGDAACEAALPTCQMTTVANATDCMPLTFQQPCDWDAQPELLGELLFPVPRAPPPPPRCTAAPCHARARAKAQPYPVSYPHPVSSAHSPARTSGTPLTLVAPLAHSRSNRRGAALQLRRRPPRRHCCEPGRPNDRHVRRLLLGGLLLRDRERRAARLPHRQLLPHRQHPPHCPAGTWSNRTGLRASTQCLPVASGYYAPTGSSLPERCPDSGFVCPGVAHDRDNDQPGSQPIAVGSGKAVALVNATLSTTQLSFSLALAASDTDGDGEAAAMALQLADFFAVATTALEVTAQQTILAVAILSDEPDAAALAETINATVAAEFSSALGTNVSALSGLQVAVVEVVTEVEDEEPCPAGYWCSAGNRIPCGTGTYNPLPEQIDMGACTACPANSDSAEASVRRGDCLCELRYYDELPNASEVRCVLCPVGSNCTVPGTTLPTLPLRRGYWRTTRESASLLQCSDGSSTDTACIGGAGSGEGSEICKPWTSGPYCRLCNVTDGTRYYDYTTSTCAECEDGNTAASVGLVLGVLAVVALATFAYGKLRPVFAQLQPRIMNVVTTLHLRCKVKQLVSLYQIVSQMGRVFVVKMPPSVTAFLSRLDVFSFELSALGLPTGCLGLSKIEEQLIFYITVPLVLGFAVFTLCVVRALVKLRGGEHGLRQAYKQGALDALPALLVLSFLVFPMVATLAFRAFSCEDFGDGASYLYADYAINCDDDAQHGPVLRLAWIAILLYPIAVPLSYVLLLRAARDAIVNEHPSTFSRALDFLHRDLEPRCYLWEVVEMFKKLFLVGFIALISPGEMVQLIIGFGFCMIFLLLTTIYDPFRADDDDLFSMLCNFVLTTCMFLCVVLNQATLSEAVEEYLADEMLERYTFNATAVSALLIGAIMLVACVVVAAVAWQLYVGMNHEVIHLQSTWQEPELPLTCKRTLWHLFLSHIWSTGQDQNATIKRQLCLLLPGVSVFLDVDDLKSIGELEE